MANLCACLPDQGAMALGAHEVVDQQDRVGDEPRQMVQGVPGDPSAHPLHLVEEADDGPMAHRPVPGLGEVSVNQQGQVVASDPTAAALDDFQRAPDVRDCHTDPPSVPSHSRHATATLPSVCSSVSHSP